MYAMARSTRFSFVLAFQFISFLLCVRLRLVSVACVFDTCGRKSSGNVCKKRSGRRPTRRRVSCIKWCVWKDAHVCQSYFPLSFLYHSIYSLGFIPFAIFLILFCLRIVFRASFLLCADHQHGQDQKDEPQAAAAGAQNGHESVRRQACDQELENEVKCIAHSFAIVQNKNRARSMPPPL